VGSGHKEASDLTTRYGQRIVDVVKEVNRHPDIWKLIKHEDTHDFFVKLTEEKERMAKASYYAKLLKVCDIQDGVETMREDFTRFRWQKEWAIQWLMRKWHVLSVMTDVDQSVFAPTQELVEQKLIELHPEFRADRRFRGPAK
jgi:hypothetical protein